MIILRQKTYSSNIKLISPEIRFRNGYYKQEQEDSKIVPEQDIVEEPEEEEYVEEESPWIIDEE